MAATPEGGGASATDIPGFGLLRQSVETWGGGRRGGAPVRRCVEDYKDFPEMTKRQVELLLEHGSLYSIRQAGRPEWQAVIETLAGTCYGRQTLDGTRHSVAEEAENPLSLLFARYEELREGYENRRYKPLLPTSEIQARRNEAHRLLNYRMRESDLAALKDLALKGKRLSLIHI